MFQKARATAPSILFLDEIDSVVGKRSDSGHRGVQERLLSTLLNEMDGIGVRLDDKMGAAGEQKLLEGDSKSEVGTNFNTGFFFLFSKGTTLYTLFGIIKMGGKILVTFLLNASCAYANQLWKIDH